MNEGPEPRLGFRIRQLNRKSELFEQVPGLRKAITQDGLAFLKDS